MWDALLRTVLHWVDCGVKVFRVDNPHTKPFPFWSWLIEQVHLVDRDVVFLAEAFTRRAVMRHLAKLGFSQSYTYFTWKNSRHELTEYVSQLAQTRRARVLSAQLLRQHARHPARLPPARRPPRVRGAARARRDAQPELRDLLGLREHRARPRARGVGGVPALREVRDQAALARRRAAADDRAAQRRPSREPPRSSASTTSRSSTPPTRR